MGYNRPKKKMKKLLVMFSIILMSLTVYADDKSATCKFESIPNAYVVAEVNLYHICHTNSNVQFDVKVNSYGVKEGAVIVKITYPTRNNGLNTIEKTIYIQDGIGKATLKGPCATSWTDYSVTAYNAICSSK